MIDSTALLTIAQGATAAACNYVFECFSIDPDPAVPVPDELHQAVILALAITVVLLEASIKANLKNEAAQEQLSALVRDLTQGIVENVKRKGLTPPPVVVESGM